VNDDESLSYDGVAAPARAHQALSDALKKAAARVGTDWTVSIRTARPGSLEPRVVVVENAREWLLGQAKEILSYQISEQAIVSPNEQGMTVADGNRIYSVVHSAEEVSWSYFDRNPAGGYPIYGGTSSGYPGYGGIGGYGAGYYYPMSAFSLSSYANPPQ
jgi:hypothetical protein